MKKISLFVLHVLLVLWYAICERKGERERKEEKEKKMEFARIELNKLARQYQDGNHFLFINLSYLHLTVSCLLISKEMETCVC